MSAVVLSSHVRSTHILACGQHELVVFAPEDLPASRVRRVLLEEIPNGKDPLPIEIGIVNVGETGLGSLKIVSQLSCLPQNQRFGDVLS